MRVDDGGGAGPNYWPNSMDGPAPDPAAEEPALPIEGAVARHVYDLVDDDFAQPAVLYAKVMTEQDRANLASNIVGHLSGAMKRLQLRQAALFMKTHEDYGTRVAEGLGLDVAEVKKLAAMSQDERVAATAK
jgi:catalase